MEEEQSRDGGNFQPERRGATFRGHRTPPYAYPSEIDAHDHYGHEFGKLIRYPPPAMKHMRSVLLSAHSTARRRWWSFMLQRINY